MTDIYDDVMPYMPSYEINGRKLAMLRATRLNLASQICLFPTHGFDPGENPNRFRILLRFL